MSIETLKPHQKEFTLYSGLDHGVKGGHFAMSSFLSGVRTADAKGMAASLPASFAPAVFCPKKSKGDKEEKDGEPDPTIKTNRAAANLK